MRKLLSRLPKPVVDRLRRGRKRYRSIRYRTRERLRPVHLGQAETETALRAAGIGDGDAVFVQAGMSAFGTIEGGPDAVIEAFRAVVGPDGLIAMPAFPLDRPALHYVREGPPFDLNHTPSRMGAVSERFRTSPGVLRSLHPTHSVTAQGPGAAALVSGHEVAETPFGNDTPFTRLVERRAHQVYFGTGVGPMTMYHAYECLRDPPYPIEVFWPRPLEARCIDGEGNEVTVRTLVHDPRVLAGRIDNDAGRQAIVRRHLVADGMRSVGLGRGEILVQRLPEMLLAFEKMLGEDVTIYRPELLAEAKVEQR
jgi:aminoglycoside 3-N-acetyltransferase